MCPPLIDHRRDKLWIAMEFCGGGSLQDIYHGMYSTHVQYMGVLCCVVLLCYLFDLACFFLPSFFNYSLTCIYMYMWLPWVCCVALPCCLFDLACFFLPSHLSLNMHVLNSKFSATAQTVLYILNPALTKKDCC